MKFRVTFMDDIDLIVTADREVDAVRKAKVLKDAVLSKEFLNTVNTKDGKDVKKYWLTYGDWCGSRCVLEFDTPVGEEGAKAAASKLKVLQENIQGHSSKSEVEDQVKKLEKDCYSEEATKYVKCN